jgi:threonine/homoserine/homoserine lactone efflux protein
MIDQVVGLFSNFWGIFSFSFVVALTGAMAPGPLLTYTIIQAARQKRSGYLVGLFVIAGHAAVELILILFIMTGFSYLIKNPFIIKTIGVIGGAVLFLFGLSLFHDLIRGNVSLAFLNPTPSGGPEVKPEVKKEKRNRPVLGGALISMSNPYWWVWWGTIGLALMTQLNVSIENWPTFAVFFIGHQTGDLLWYLFVSTLAFTGVRFLNKKIYYGILGLCGAFMMIFGAYLGLSPLGS